MDASIDPIQRAFVVFALSREARMLGTVSSDPLPFLPQKAKQSIDLKS